MIRDALDKFAIGQNKVWTSDRVQTLGASEVGQCARKTFWLKNEADPRHAAPRDTGYRDSWGALMRGTVFENEFWEPALRATYGDRLLFSGPDQQTFVSGFLSATPDGLLTDLSIAELEAIAAIGRLRTDEIGPDVMVECKTADPRTNLTEAKAENVFQTHVQMGLIRKLTEYRPTHSILSYTDASFWNEGREFIIPFDEKVFAVAEQRAATIMTATSAAELKPEGWIAGGKECDYCPFTTACGVERRRVPDNPVASDPQFTAEITDLCRSAKALESARNDNDIRLRDVQQQIKDRLRDKNVRAIPGVVSWSSVKGRSGYDNAAIKQAAIEAGIDIEQFAKVGEPTDRLTISLPSGTE